MFVRVLQDVVRLLLLALRKKPLSFIIVFLEDNPDYFLLGANHFLVKREFAAIYFLARQNECSERTANHAHWLRLFNEQKEVLQREAHVQLPSLSRNENMCSLYWCSHPSELHCAVKSKNGEVSCPLWRSMPRHLQADSSRAKLKILVVDRMEEASYPVQSQLDHALMSKIPPSATS